MVFPDNGVMFCSFCKNWKGLLIIEEVCIRINTVSSIYKGKSYF